MVPSGPCPLLFGPAEILSATATGETGHHHLFLFPLCPAIRRDFLSLCGAVRSAADGDSGRAIRSGYMFYTRQSISLTSSHVERWPTSARQSTDYVIHQLALRRAPAGLDQPISFLFLFLRIFLFLLLLGRKATRRKEKERIVLAPVDGRENTQGKELGPSVRPTFADEEMDRLNYARQVTGRKPKLLWPPFTPHDDDDGRTSNASARALVLGRCPAWPSITPRPSLILSLSFHFLLSSSSRGVSVETNNNGARPLLLLQQIEQQRRIGRPAGPGPPQSD